MAIQTASQPNIFLTSDTQLFQRKYSVSFVRPGTGVQKGESQSSILQDHFCFLFVEIADPVERNISSKGEEALACLFGAQPCEGLDLLRFRKFVPDPKTSRAKE